MAEKDDWDLDDLDDDLDFGDFDEPESGGGPAENRDPIKQTARTVRDSALGAIFPRSQRDRIILDAMPQEATPAYEGFQDVNAAVADVYSHTKDELIKTRRSLKIQTRQLLPTMRKYLPESITAKVDEWSKPEDSYENNYDPQQALIDRGMGDVFGTEDTPAAFTLPQPKPEHSEGEIEVARQEAEDEQKKQVEDSIKETITNLKQDRLHETLIGIAKDTNGNFNLQRSVTVNWQRKILELNYRQLFALQEIAKIGQSRFERDTPALEAIVKNTALPDYAKEEFGEIQGALFKRKMAEWISPAHYTEEFIDKMRDNAKKKVSEFLGEGRGLMDLVMGGLQEDDDMGLEDNSTVAPDARQDNLTQKGIGTATGLLAKKFINPQRDRLTAAIREKLSENDDVDAAVNKALYNFTNLPQIANSAISGERDSALGSLFKVLNELGIAESYSREDIALEARTGEHLEKAAKFDNRTWLTLNEVIPSWLAKINTSIRAGYGEETDEVYDVTSRSFVDKDVVAERVRKHIGADDQRERMRKRIADVTDIIDEKGDLNNSQREKLGKFLESRVSEGKEFNVDALLKDDTILDRYMDWNTKDKVKEVLTKTSGGKEFNLSNKVNNELGAMQSSIGSYQQRLNEMVQQYGERAVLDSGIIDYNREEDKLETEKDLTDIYKDVGTVASLGKRHPEPTVRQRMERRAGNVGTDVQTPAPNNITVETLTAALDPNALSEVLYGPNANTNFVKLLEGRGDTETPAVNVDSVVEAIRMYSSKPHTEEILKHVKAMDESGVLIAMGEGEERDEPRGDDEKPKKRRGWFSGRKSRRRKRRPVKLAGQEEKGLIRRWGSLGADTVGTVGGGIVGGGKWVGGKLASARNAIGLNPERMKSIAAAPFKTAFDVVRSGVRGFGAFGKAAIGARDIYDANGKVILSGAKLKDGAYFKKTGKDKFEVMKTLEDLKDAKGVYDKDGNVIISRQDLALAGELSYYKDKRWWKVSEIAGGLMGDGLNKLVTLPMKLFKGREGGLLKKVGQWVNGYPDMYVNGSKTPRIKAHLLREGHYVCQGKVVRKPGDIRDVVTDIHGNEIISLDEITNPDFKLTDRWGNEVRTPLGRMGARAGRLLGGTWNLAKKVAKAPLTVYDKVRNSRFAKMAGKRLSDNFVTRWWNGDPKDKKAKDKKGSGWFRDNQILNFGGGVKRSNEVLMRIYQLLNKRLKGKPESEDWMKASNKPGLVSRAVGNAKGLFRSDSDKPKVSPKERFAKVKDKHIVDFKERKERYKKKLDVNGKLGSLKPKNVKEGVTERFKLWGNKVRDVALKEPVDYSKVKESLINRDSAATVFYRDKIAKEIAKRENRLGVKTRKLVGRDNIEKIVNVDPKELAEQAKAKLKEKKEKLKKVDAKDVAEDLKEKAKSKASGLKSTVKRKVTVRNLKDTLTGRNSNLDIAAKSLLDRKGGTRELYRDKIAKTISSRKAKEGDSVQQAILAKLGEMNTVTQGMFFNNIRKDAIENGMPEGRLSGMMNAFSKNNPFKKGTAGRDYFKFLRNTPRNDKEPRETLRDKYLRRTKKKDGKEKGWFGKLGAIIATAVSGVLWPAAKFIVGGLGKVVMSLGGSLLKKGAVALGTKAAAMAAPLVSGAAAGAATIASGVATGVAAIGGLPVIAAGLAVGAVGWAVYAAATRERAYYLDKLRLAQYGNRDYDMWSNDEAAKVRYLEDNLRKYVTFDKDGLATLRGLSSDQAIKLGVGYGIDEASEQELISFHSYLQRRFIPIFLNWLTAIRKVESTPALADIGKSSKVSKKEMQQIFTTVKLPADSAYFTQDVDPRKADRGWFKSATDWMGITTDKLLTGAEVEEVTREVGAEIDARKDPRESKDKWRKSWSTAMGGKGGESITVKGISDRFEEIDDRDRVKAMTEHGAKTKRQLTEEGIKKIKDENIGTKEMETMRAKLVGKKKAAPRMLNALQGLRLKTYGLVTLNSIDVQAILELEEKVLPFINPKSGVFTGEIDKAISHLVQGGEGEKASKVRYWFRNRFLPTYMTYVMAVKRYIPSADPNNLVLSGQYLYEIATILLQTKVEINGVEESVWFVRTTPFDGEPNVDPESITDELATLKKISKSAELTVDTLPKEKHYGKVTSKKKYGAEAMDEFIEKNKAVSVTPQGPASNAMQFPGNTIDLSTLKGAHVATVEAKEGDYKSIRDSKTDIPDIINEAAAVAGMNPLLMMTIAMMESSLNPNAKPPKGPAEGLYQFMPDTWESMMKRAANKYGIPEGTRPTDPVAAALLAAELMKDDAKIVKGSLGKDPSAVDYYIPHFLGAGRAREFYANLKKDPNAIAADIMSPKAVKNNMAIFYRGKKPRTFSEVYQYFHSKMSSNESHVRDLVPGATSSPANNVVDMFKDMPKYNEKRRDSVVQAKANRDVKAVEASSGTNAIASANPMYDKANRQSAVDVSKSLEVKAKEFAETNPSASEKDKEVYRERVLAKVNEANRAQEPDIRTQNDDRRDSILDAQYGVQKEMAEELKNIRKLLTLVMEGKENSREYEQAKRDLAAQDAKPPKRKLEVEHGQPLISNKRVMNM